MAANAKTRQTHGKQKKAKFSLSFTLYLCIIVKQYFTRHTLKYIYFS